MDGRINSAEVMSASCKNFVNFGRLTLEFTVIVWRPFILQMREIVETRSIIETRIRQWMTGTAERICAKFTQKTCLVLRSDEFECQGQRSKVVTRAGRALTCCAFTTPRSVDGMERPRCR